MTFHLMFVHNIIVYFGLGWRKSNLLGKSCSLGSPNVLIVFLLFVISAISHISFEGGVGF